MNEIIKYIDMKLIDFGMSKIDIKRNLKFIDNNNIYDNILYLIPKILKKKKN